MAGVVTILILHGLGILAAARLRRLVAADVIGNPIRQRIYDRLPEKRQQPFVEFLACVWCVSVWTSAGVTAALLWGGGVSFGLPWWVEWPLLTLVYSQLIGAAATAFDTPIFPIDPVDQDAH